MIKLFMSDMDGTLLNGEFQISEENVRAVYSLKECGIEFAVATGRIYYDAAGICGSYNIKPYIISNNGACAFNKEGEIIFANWLKEEEVQKIADFLEENKISYGFGKKEEYLASRDWEINLDKEWKRLTAEGISISLQEINFAKAETIGQNGFRLMGRQGVTPEMCKEVGSISVVSYSEEKKTLLKGFLRQYEHLGLSVSGRHSAEIMGKNNTKGHAMQLLAGYMDIDVADIAAVGDDYNDLEMLRMAGMGIAMDNAPEEVKKAGVYVTKSNNEDGVAYVIWNKIKNNK